MHRCTDARADSRRCRVHSQERGSAERTTATGTDKGLTYTDSYSGAEMILSRRALHRIGTYWDMLRPRHSTSTAAVGYSSCFRGRLVTSKPLPAFPGWFLLGGARIKRKGLRKCVHYLSHLFVGPSCMLRSIRFHLRGFVVLDDVTQ